MNYLENKIYTVEEFSKLIGTSRGTVLRLIEKGRIIAFRISDAPKSPWRIRESEIDRLISFELHKKHGE